MRFLIIGGSDAGISAALRARELDQSADITVVLADSFPNYSICGLPFYLSGETPDWHALAHRTDFEGIALLKNHRAQGIDARRKTVSVVDDKGSEITLPYDRLLIGTGARPITPPIAGLELPGVYLLHTMEDSFRLHRHLVEQGPRSAIIVGSGYIGLEMADALKHRGLEVTLIGRSETVLPTVDPHFGHMIEAELRRNAVRVKSGVEVEAITKEETGLIVHGSGGLRDAADIVIVGAGVQPNSELAAAAGVQIGLKRAILVNRCMETSLPNVYAAGDCVETWHRVLGAYSYLPLGTTSHKQGRVAGENAVGGNRQFEGSVGTQVVKVFELAIARTGVRDLEAAMAELGPLTVESKHFDHKAYYPGARDLWMRVTGARASGRLLGAQILGHWCSEVAKRIDIYAAALFHDMTIEGLNDLDLSYTPPLGSPWDAVQMAAQEWTRAAAR